MIIDYLKNLFRKEPSEDEIKELIQDADCCVISMPSVHSLKMDIDDEYAKSISSVGGNFTSDDKKITV